MSRFTNDSSEYLVFGTNFTLDEAQSDVTISIVGRKANAYVLFVDGAFVGEQWDEEHDPELNEIILM